MGQDLVTVLGQRLKQRREELNYSQITLSNLSGVAQTQISRYERGEAEPTVGAVVALADTLNTSIDWLLGRDNATPSPLSESNLTLLEQQALSLFRAKLPQRQSAIIEVLRWTE